MKKVMLIITIVFNMLFPQGVDDLSPSQLREYNLKKITVQQYTRTTFWTPFADNEIKYDIFEGFKEIDLGTFLIMTDYLDEANIKDIKRQEKINKLTKRLLIVDGGAILIGAIGGAAFDGSGFTIACGVIGMLDGIITSGRLLYNKMMIVNNPESFQVPYNKMLEMAEEYNEVLLLEIYNPTKSPTP